MSGFDELFSDDRLAICRWETPGVAFPANSAYVELVWGGVLGPTATLAYRRLAALVQHDVPAVDLADLAAGLGVGHKGGRHSPLSRALHRLVIFGAARLDDDGRLAVRPGLRPMEVSRLARLGPTARQVHHQALSQRVPGSDPPTPTGRPAITPERSAPVLRQVVPSPARPSQALTPARTLGRG